MKTRTLLAILVTFCLGFHGESPTARADEPSGPLKVVVHINVPEPGVQGAGLKNVTNLLKEAPDTQVEVVCHGAGIGLVEKARTDHAEAVEALIEKGVEVRGLREHDAAEVDPQGGPAAGRRHGPLGGRRGRPQAAEGRVRLLQAMSRGLRSHTRKRRER